MTSGTVPGPTVLRDDPYARVEMDPAKRLFKITWKKYVPGFVMRPILLEAVKALKEHGMQLWLSDSREMGAILKPEQDWILNELTPRLVESGVRRMAVVQSQDFFYRSTAQRIVSRAQPNVPYEVSIFDDVEKAEAWLLGDERATA